MASNKKISLKLLVNKKHRRVVFAESDKDFVDILLSFLTMPIGTIIRLLGKSSPIKCMTNLYESIENLEMQNLQTKACKSMLLRPLNAAGPYCENLALNIDDTEPRKFFACEELGCRSKATCFYSSVPNLQCSCGKQMSYKVAWGIAVAKEPVDGVFVKGGLNFIISDDLHIMPASTSILLSLFGKLEQNDGSIFEEMILDLGHDEILNLLRSALSSDTPLTNLCFGCSATNDTSNIDGMFQLIPKSESEDNSEAKEIKVKLLLTKNDDKVVHMEGGEDMADLVISFLTLPLGSVVKLLDVKSSFGWADNIYSSIENLCPQEKDCFKSEHCKMILLRPKLAPFFSCKNQLLVIEESVPGKHSVRGCYSCFWSNGSVCSTKECSHGIGIAEFKPLNPKSSKFVTELGGGYSKGGKFVVTDDLHLASLSLISTFNIVHRMELNICDLVEKDISIGKAQALNMLKAALVSETALTQQC